jgi:hypothetical protein
MSERPPIRDVLRIIYIRGAHGARQVALVLECGHWITRRRPPVHLAKGLACVGCVVEKVLREDAEEAKP